MLDGLLIARASHLAMDRAPSSFLASQVKSQAHVLESDRNRPALVEDALWRLLKPQHGYTDEDLIAKFTELDVSDGRLDGRVALKTAPQTCPSCGRTLSKGMPTCIYCGQIVQRDPFDR